MMARRARYVPDNSSFGEFILSDQMRDVTFEVAQDIGKEARRKTPLGDGEDGHMRDKFSIDREGGVLEVGGNLRVMVTIENDDPYAASVEFGSKRNKRRRMLGRAGAQFGDFKGNL